MNKWSIILSLSAVVAQAFVDISPPVRASVSDGTAASAKAALQETLLAPLEKKEAERSRYSRAVLPPQTRRIRILGVSKTDAKGRPFLSFAIDESRAYGIRDQEVAESDWLKDAITGCVYPETAAVMVKRGEVYYPSSILLGIRTPIASADVCRSR